MNQCMDISGRIDKNTIGVNFAFEKNFESLYYESLMNENKDIGVRLRHTILYHYLHLCLQSIIAARSTFYFNGMDYTYIYIFILKNWLESKLRDEAAVEVAKLCDGDEETEKNAKKRKQLSEEEKFKLK